jgi:hypothetical protein
MGVIEIFFFFLIMKAAYVLTLFKLRIMGTWVSWTGIDLSYSGVVVAW